MVKSTVIVIDTVLAHNLLAPIGKDTLRYFPLLGDLSKQSKFQSYLYETKIRNKKFQPDSNILASLKAGLGNCLPFHCFSASQEVKNRYEKSKFCSVLALPSSVVFHHFHTVAHFPTEGNLTTHFGEQNLTPFAKTN